MSTKGERVKAGFLTRNEMLDIALRVAKTAFVPVLGEASVRATARDDSHRGDFFSVTAGDTTYKVYYSVASPKMRPQFLEGRMLVRLEQRHGNSRSKNTRWWKNFDGEGKQLGDFFMFIQQTEGAGLEYLIVDSREFRRLHRENKDDRRFVRGTHIAFEEPAAIIYPMEIEKRYSLKGRLVVANSASVQAPGLLAFL